MEIKVITKALGLLEILASKPHILYTPNDLAKELNIPRSTCVRLLKMLTKNGYLEQTENSRGYRLGPMVYALGQGKKYLPKLSAVAETEIPKIAQELNISLMLVLRVFDSRVFLAAHNGNPLCNLDMDKVRYQDCHLTVSGRMLLAHANQAQRDEVIKHWGLLDCGFFTNMSPEEINLELDKIKTKDILMERYGDTIIAAIPVFEGKKIRAAIGGAWIYDEDLEHTNFICDRLKKLADKYSAILTSINMG